MQILCYLTTHSLSWLWGVVFLGEVVEPQLGCFGVDCSLHWRSRSDLYGALWAQAHPRAARFDVHAFSSYSTARGSPDGEEDWTEGADITFVKKKHISLINETAGITQTEMYILF